MGSELPAQLMREGLGLIATVGGPLFAALFLGGLVIGVLQAATQINDPAVEVAWAARDVRPSGTSRLNTEAFTAIEANVKKHYDVLTLPTMSTGATDMAYLRGKGIQCYGVGPAIDIEDGPKGFGAHSDQERILESELHRFVRFTWDAVVGLAGAK